MSLSSIYSGEESAEDSTASPSVSTEEPDEESAEESTESEAGESDGADGVVPSFSSASTEESTEESVETPPEESAPIGAESEAGEEPREVPPPAVFEPVEREAGEACEAVVEEKSEVALMTVAKWATFGFIATTAFMVYAVVANRVRAVLGTDQQRQIPGV